MILYESTIEKERAKMVTRERTEARENGGCNVCAHRQKGANDMPCKVCCRSYLDQYTPMNAGEMIRSMTDAELAEFLSGIDGSSRGQYQTWATFLERPAEAVPK